MPKDVDLTWLHEVADQLGITDDERPEFVKEGMLRKGYKEVTNTDWEEPEADKPKPTPMFKRSSAPGNTGGQSRAAGQYRE